MKVVCLSKPVWVLQLFEQESVVSTTTGWLKTHTHLPIFNGPVGLDVGANLNKLQIKIVKPVSKPSGLLRSHVAHFKQCSRFGLHILCIYN